jgi:hypothetical protein
VKLTYIAAQLQVVLASSYHSGSSGSDNQLQRMKVTSLQYFFYILSTPAHLAHTGYPGCCCCISTFCSISKMYKPSDKTAKLLEKQSTPRTWPM